jgi:hypothetical protein
LQYADDITICLEVDEDSIAPMKFLLYCFGNMSGLKINYHKSEVMLMGVSKEESSRIVNVLNCREGTLPMRYLGILISNTKLYTSNLNVCRCGLKKGCLLYKDCI